MKNKLYYKDPYLSTFETKAVKQAEDANGIYIVLEETAFYPTGGGQPNDTGLLNEISVVNVEEVNGEIRHYVEKALSRIDGKIVHKTVLENMIYVPITVKKIPKERAKQKSLDIEESPPKEFFANPKSERARSFLEKVL